MPPHEVKGVDPGHVLHHEEQPLARLADLVEADDVRVVEPAEDGRLAEEAGDRLRRTGHRRYDRLERDLGVVGRASGQVDHAHAAPAQLPLVR